MIIFYNWLSDSSKPVITLTEERKPGIYIEEAKLCYFCMSHEMKGQKLYINISDRTQPVPVTETKIISYRAEPNLSLSASSKTMVSLFNIFGPSL